MSYAGFSFACSPGSKCSAAFQGCGTRTRTSLNSPPGWRPCSRDRPAASRLAAVTGVASRLSPSMMKWIGIRKRGRLLPLQVLRPVHVGPGDVARDVPLPSSRHEGQAPPNPSFPPPLDTSGAGSGGNPHSAHNPSCPPNLPPACARKRGGTVRTLPSLYKMNPDQFSTGPVQGTMMVETIEIRSRRYGTVQEVC